MEIRKEMQDPILGPILKGLGSEMIRTQWDMITTKVGLMSGCISRGVKPKKWEENNQLFSLGLCPFLRNDFSPDAPGQVVSDPKQGIWSHCPPSLIGSLRAIEQLTLGPQRRLWGCPRMQVSAQSEKGKMGSF